MIRPLAILLSACALPAQSQFRPVRGTSLPPLTNPGSLASGDVDGDGDVDLVVGSHSRPTQLLLNDGRGRFTNATSGRMTTPPSISTVKVDLVDVDGDGDLDLLACSPWSDRVHLNNGAGVFTDVSATALPPNDFFGLDQVVADFDGDGDVDWFVADFDKMHLYLNNGAGVFRDASAANLPTEWVPAGRSRFAVDLDGDGDLDIGLATGSSAHFLLNQGGARFVFAPPGYLPGRGDGEIWVGDVNGDGRPDVFMNSGRFLFRNLGGGQFLDVSATSLPAGDLTHGTIFDADLDGDLDVVGPDRLWLNDGAGRFTAANARGPVGANAALFLADLDGDGDGDLIALAGTPQVYLNFLRQIDAPSPARIGQGYTVDMYVRPGFAQNVTAAVLALAFRGAVTPMPPLGTLRLDPRSIHLLGVHAALPPGGHVQFSYAIPSDPTLVGLQLHHQALVIESLATAALSNAIVDVIQ